MDNLQDAISHRTKWDRRFLQLAALVASWSKDPSTKVGAVIVDQQNRIVSTGYNGFPQSMPDREEYLTNRDEKYSRVVHGEINAILFAPRSVEGATLYTYPFMPCDRCAVQVIQAGISRVVAPICPPDKADRWAAIFEKSRNYFDECGVLLREMEL